MRGKEKGSRLELVADLHITELHTHVLLQERTLAGQPQAKLVVEREVHPCSGTMQLGPGLWFPPAVKGAALSARATTATRW